MLMIGVLDSANSNNTIKAINKITNLEESGCKKARAVKVSHDSKVGENIDILIINEFHEEQYLTSVVKRVRDNGVLILNADEKKPCQFRMDKPLKIITYGFNTKSSVTASSVLENEYKTIQCCIQRTLKTLTENDLEPQEFSVKMVLENDDVYNILSAVTATILCGAEIEKIDAHIFV